jgi:surface antigen
MDQGPLSVQVECFDIGAMRTSKPVMIAALLALSLCLAAAAQAQGSRDVLSGSVAAKFNQQDFDLLWAAITEVSDSKKVGTVKTWENAATGNGGSLKLLNVFTSTEGRDCRRLRMDNHAKKQKATSGQNVCMGPDGKWLLDADAKPAPKPAPKP